MCACLVIFFIAGNLIGCSSARHFTISWLWSKCVIFFSESSFATLLFWNMEKWTGTIIIKMKVNFSIRKRLKIVNQLAIVRDYLSKVRCKARMPNSTPVYSKRQQIMDILILIKCACKGTPLHFWVQVIYSRLAAFFVTISTCSSQF